MATIPGSGGRRVDPGAVRMPGVSPAAFGMASAQAIEGIGNTVAGIGQRSIDEQRQEFKIEQDRQRQMSEAAERAREAAHLGSVEDQMRDAADEISEGIRTGQVDKTKAESIWADRSKQIAGEGMEGFRTETRPLVEKQISGLGLKLGNTVRKAREQRDRQDVTVGIDTTLEQMQRAYKTDPVGAQQQAMATLEALGPFSNYTPQQIAAKGQTWKEQSQFTVGFEAVSAGRNDRKALDRAQKLVNEGLPDLEPQRRALLNDRADAYRLSLDQKAQMAAERAQREAERRLKNAEAEFNVFQSMADKGTVLDPNYIDSAIVKTAGTPYQAGVKALAQQAAQTGGIAAQPVNTQRQMLTAIDAEIARGGRSYELDKRREQVEKVLRGSEQDLRSDALNAGLQRGVITSLQPLNFSAGIAGLVQQLGDRVVQADRVGVWAGRPVSPLQAVEAQNLGRLLGPMSADQRATALQQISALVPAPQAQALAAQIDKDDRPLAIALALGSSRTTEDRPTSVLVLKGAAALEQKTIKEDPKAIEGWRGRINAELAPLYSNPQQLEMASDAARYILAGKVSEGASGSGSDIRNAVRLAIGGTIEDRNGSRIVLPAGVESKAFARRLTEYPADALAKQLPDGKVYVRGQAIDAQQFLATLPSAQLRTVGRGRYVVLAGGSVAANADATPLIIEAQ